MKTSIRDNGQTQVVPFSGNIYMQLFHKNPLPMWIYEDATLRFLDVNDAAIEQYGYSRKEFLALTLEDIRPKEDIPRLIRSVAARENKQYSSSGIWKHVKKNGEVIYAEISSHRIQVENREAVLVLANNVTETKRSEEILEKKNQELRAVKERLEKSEKSLKEAQAMAQLGSWEVDSVTYATNWSDEMFAIFGTNRNNTIPSLEAFLSFIHPDDRGQVRQRIQQGEETLEGYTFNCRIIRQDGILRYIHTTCKFILSQSGELVRIYGIIRDITETHQAEEKLRHSEARLKQAQTIAKIGNWEINFATNISKWSDEAYRIYGLEPGEHRLTFESWLSFIHPDDLEYVNNVIKESQATLSNNFLSHRIIRPDGGVRHICSESRFEFDGNGKPTGMYGVLFDVTDSKNNELELKSLNEKLKRRAEELAASNNELERFAYVASHDLQEPLRMVSSFLQLLEKRYKNSLDETANRYIRFAVDGAGRMKRLILDLLEYSRIGVIGDGFAEMDTGEIVDGVLETFKENIEKENTVVTKHPLPVIKANPTQISQLFQNLISNALKYNSSPIAEIEIGCYEKENEWEFFVKDNGMGIDPQYFEKIFIIFQRLHNKNQFSGTGIGLAICKKIIEKHGGRIWLESIPGTGSTFFFSIKK